MNKKRINIENENSKFLYFVSSLAIVIHFPFYCILVGQYLPLFFVVLFFFIGYEKKDIFIEFFFKKKYFIIWVALTILVDSALVYLIIENSCDGGHKSEACIYPFLFFLYAFMSSLVLMLYSNFFIFPKIKAELEESKKLKSMGSDSIDIGSSKE